MKIEIKAFNELSAADLYELLKLRSKVFVVEQNCVYQDVDGKDVEAIHLLGKQFHQIIAYLRIFRPGDYFKDASIGRVVVDEGFRGEGYANSIMVSAMEYIKQNFTEKSIELSAQKYLVQFYKDLGFQQKGEEYLEDGIPHIKMRYEL